MCVLKMLTQSTQDDIIVGHSSFADLMRSHSQTKRAICTAFYLLQHSFCGTHVFLFTATVQHMGLIITDFIYILRAWRLLRQPLLFLQEPLVL